MSILIDEMLTIDVETTVRGGHDGKSPSPYFDANELVAMGVSVFSEQNADSNFKARYYQKYLPRPEDKHKHWGLSNSARNAKLTRLAGHNIKFDINWLRRENANVYLKNKRDGLAASEPIREALINVKIWDTQIAEYLLSGQQTKLARLNDLAPEYGGTTKLDAVKELWDAGVDTLDIDEDLLMEYLQGDVENTELIAIQQMMHAENEGIYEWINTQMDALKAIAEMEYNGMHIDIAVLAHIEDELKTSLADEIDSATSMLARLEPHLPIEHVNLSSNIQLSAILFGGEIKWKERELVGKYKNGKDKYKQVEKTYKCARRIEPAPEWEGKRPGIYSVSEDVLKSVLTNLKTEALALPKTTRLIENLLEIRRLEKELGTYVKGIQKAWRSDGCIHGNLNQNITDTGRLSSSAPNLQNFPSNDESNIKKVFTSRWGDDGVIIEADYKQLEVICLAFLSRDPMLMDDIRNGRDIHYETGKIAMGWSDPSDMDHDTRRVVKTINFGLIYGGGAATLAKQAGVARLVAEKCIKAFYTRYPRVKEYVDELLEEAKACATYQGTSTPNGLPANEYHYHSLTGRKYVFREQDTPPWVTWTKARTSLSRQQISNYPIQGLATGDIVPMILGVLYTGLISLSDLKDDCLMINTVHDSIIFDCKKDKLEVAMSVIKHIMERAPKYLKEKLDIDFDLPLGVDIKSGPNWKDCS